MKIIISFLFALTIKCNLFGQKNRISEKDSPNAIFNCLIVSLSKTMATEKKQFPYKEIIVIDERPDTSKCGYWYSKKHPRIIKLCFNDGFQKNVSSFINTYLKGNLNPTGHSVLACIKKFWTNSDDIDFRTIFLRIDFYIKTDSCYYPLYRFDDTFNENSNKSSEPNEFIEKAIISSISKLFIPKPIYPDMRRLYFEQIDSFNKQSKKLLVLKEKIPAKGVYLNFVQFKNNQPAYTDFETDLAERTDVIFVKGKNVKDSAITDAWGFCDGENTFIRIAMNYFPIFRCGNTFDLYGFDKITESRFFQGTPTPYHGYTPMSAIDVGVQGLLGMIKSKSKNLRPYQINMDTGELY
jgi:hypothetical protein